MDIMKMMQQAKQLQEQMATMQEQVGALRIEGTSGAGMVSVTLNGKGEMLALSVDPSLLKASEAEILEDLIVAAHNDAKGKADAAMQEKMQDMTGGLNLPAGMKLPF
jgi:DNA-binding YbaB/EbfC family protein